MGKVAQSANAEGATKRCTTCSTDKARSEFYADKRASSGLQAECKECVKAKAKSRYAKTGSSVTVRDGCTEPHSCCAIGPTICNKCHMRRLVNSDAHKSRARATVAKRNADREFKEASAKRLKKLNLDEDFTSRRVHALRSSIGAKGRDHAKHLINRDAEMEAKRLGAIHDYFEYEHAMRRMEQEELEWQAQQERAE